MGYEEVLERVCYEMLSTVTEDNEEYEKRMKGFEKLYLFSNEYLGVFLKRINLKDKRVLTTGYNGAPAGIKSCADKGECIRRVKNIASGTMQEVCYAVHAEQNAICQAAKLGVSLEGATIYVTHQPCVICTRMIINSGIKKVIYKHGYPDDFALELFSQSDVEIIKYNDWINP